MNRHNVLRSRRAYATVDHFHITDLFEQYGIEYTLDYDYAVLHKDRHPHIPYAHPPTPPGVGH